MKFNGFDLEEVFKNDKKEQEIPELGEVIDLRIQNLERYIKFYDDPKLKRYLSKNSSDFPEVIGQLSKDLDETYELCKEELEKLRKIRKQRYK